MGCEMTAVWDLKDRHQGDYLEKLPDWFQVWEERLSRFNPTSELSRLNRTRDAMRVSPVLWDVLQAGVRAMQFSEGLVSPFLLDQVESAGYDRSFELIGEHSLPRASRAEKPAKTSRHLELDPKTRSVKLPENVRIDLGGIAKGWAVDRALRSLTKAGSGLVDAGGDIGISGPQSSGEGWPIAIANPFRPDEDLDLIVVSNGGIATSGRDYRRWKINGKWQHHLIDPSTGLPAETDVLSSTVIAPSAVQAEIAAKMVFIMGSKSGLEWLDAQPAYSGLVVQEDGNILHSRGYKTLLWRK
jgi:FAD:protein FMN transferase